MEITRSFHQINKEDAAIAGGKGASLGEMTQAGIPVPPGFVVLSGAFERFLEETDLNVEIDAILHSVKHEQVHTVEDASEKIRALIESAEMPKDIAKAVEQSFRELDAEFVAVRSSATSEDSADAAWAGQLESYLNTTDKDLLEKVQKCWASLFTPRAIFYRFEKGLHGTKISVAVVVQKMVASEISGIAFSVHPVTEDRNQLIIEAGFGLGEAIVSGQITPDGYVVEKEPRRIIDVNVYDQKRGLFRAEGGGNEWRDIPSERSASRVLSDEQILELSELILRIENHYGFPCDIEWAFEKGKFYIVQSRPITTLSAKAPAKEIFTKTYTRNFCIIMQQAWYAANKENIIPKLGLKEYPYSPPYIYFMKDGVEEVWENTKAMGWLLDKVLEKIRADEDFFPKAYARYFEKLSEIEPWWNKDIRTLGELKAFVERVYAAVSDFVIIYAALEDATLPDEIRKRAEEFREKDVFFAECNQTITRALKSIYPDFGYLVVYITTEELGKMVVIEELKKRDRGFVLIPDLLRETMSFEEMVHRFPEYEFKTEGASYEGGGLRGQSAFRGKVSGIVRIVKRTDQSEEVLEGEIIISPMTTPDFLPAMKRAAAFVTDEGGITCHAAIIAREMGKPCIIGTKVATQVFKDGDLVEVDAEKGIVRKIETTEETAANTNESYELHFRQTDFLFIFTDITFRKENYGAFDYVLLQKGDEIAGYLTEKGKQQAFDFGKVWLDKERADHVIHDLENLASDLKSGEVTERFDALPKTDMIGRWTLLENAMDRFVHWYRYCEHPVVAALEQKVREACGSEDDLIRVLQHPQSADDLGFSEDAKQQLHLLIKIGELKFAIHDAIGPLWERCERFLSEVGERYGLTFAQVTMLRTDEMTKLLKEGERPSGEALEDRLGGLVFIPQEGATGLLLTGQDYSSWKNRIEKVHVDEVRGTPAFRGKAKGRVKIHLSLVEGEEIPKGSVLMAGMTNPQLVPFLKNAAAIVTDEGGLTCHAAIVARELKIPCIIGTKVATQVFKDGDLVEVDAEKGTIRKVEEKNTYVLGNQDVDTSFLTLEMTWSGMTSPDVEKYAGSPPIESILEIVNGSTINYYVNASQLKSFVSSSANALTTEQGLLEKVEATTVELVEKMKELATEYVEKVDTLPEVELASLLERIKQLQSETAIVGSPVAFADIFGDITNRLTGALSERHNLKHRPSVYMQVLGTPKEKSMTESAYEDIGANELDDEELLKKYFWLDQGYIGRGLTPHELKAIKRERAGVAQEEMPSSEVLRDELGLSDDEGRMFQVSASLIKIKSLRADARQYLHVLTNRIADRIAREYDLASQDVEAMSTDEVCDMLRKGLRPSRLTERRKHSVVIPREHLGGYDIFVGDQAATFLEKNLAKEEIENNDELTGQVAQAGKVTGVARLVFGPQHNGKVQEGEILFSTATSPQLLPAMKRAAAFVTDVGGITSHAAIVAREMGKPCVVGTKYATQVFKDGDLVEVDAEQGIVKIIERA